MRRMMVVLLVLGAACGSSTATTTTTAVPAISDRLVVLTADSALVTMDPDGSDVVTLVEGSDRVVVQPTWSPGGERLAWGEVVLGTSPDPVAVITALPDGSDRTRTPVANPPFYLAWSPQGDRLVLLRNGATTLEAGIIDVAGDGTEETVVASGQPFYFAWDPEGATILANIGVGDRMEGVGVDGEIATLDADPGQFQAPAWVGASAFWVRQVADGQELVVSAPDGTEGRVLASFEGFVHFVVSPDGAKVAYRVLDQAPPAVSVSFNAQSTGVDGVLTVVDVATGETTVVDRDNPFAFLWSPDSAKLLYLSVLSDGFAWSVWSDGASTVFDPFVPSRAFGRDYLPFFDQFAQSIEVWAPDSESFTYGGRGLDDSTSSIWVQPLDGPARRIADGIFAAFIPAP